MKAGTSPHLAEQLVGHREFVAGTLYDVLTGTITPPSDRPVVFSPFGLGVLDMAVAKHVYDRVLAAGQLHTVPDFFHEAQALRLSPPRPVPEARPRSRRRRASGLSRRPAPSTDGQLTPR